MKKIKYGPWDIVRLRSHTDRYRVYSCQRPGVAPCFMFCGLNSDTVRWSDDPSVVVQKVLEKSQ